jgi:hypothetical protein
MMLNGPTTFGQSANRLLKPLTSADVDKSFSGASDSFLSAVMYLKQEGVQPSSGTTTPGRMTSPRLATHFSPSSLLCYGYHHLFRLSKKGIRNGSYHRGFRLGVPGCGNACSVSYFPHGGHIVAETYFLIVSFRRLGCFSFNERAMELYERIRFVRGALIEKSLL